MSNRRKSRSRTAATASKELCGIGDTVDFAIPVTQRIEGLTYGSSYGGDKNTTFQRSRYFSTRSDFVRTINWLRTAIYNFGFRLVAVEKSDKGKLDKWMRDRDNAETLQNIRGFVRDAWTEFRTTTNVISLWRNDSQRPLVLEPEDVIYTDEFGIEKLIITHKFTADEIDALKVSPQTKARLKKSKKITITHDDDLFSFQVLKLEKLGKGLGWPDMLPVLLRLGEFESHEVRQNILAQKTRRVIELHKIGHETRYGLPAGTSANFINTPRIKATKEQLQGKVGAVELLVNFDQYVEYPGPDPKHWDGKKFESIHQRLLWWAMPLGHMIVARAFNPNLMPILEFMALEERELMRPHFEFVLNDAFKQKGDLEILPCEVTVKWDNKILKDARLLAQLIQNGLNSGPISQQTYREAAAVDSEEEDERKELEAKKPKTTTDPIYDGNHGKPGKGNGKPPGKKDKS